MTHIESEVVEARQKQLRKILASIELGNSRQSQEFLAYAAEAAFQGRVHLEQTEIAERVLRRGKDFNPLDDASVRKLATLTRQRLEAYYAGPGANDPIVVTMPVRSYIPVFREREIPPPPPPVVEEPPAPVANPPHRRLLPGLALTLLAIAFSAALWPRAARPVHPAFTLHTVKGDVMHDRNDLPGSALQLGPRLGQYDEVTVRLTFTPEHALQQAGLLIWQDADNYVKLGRQFQSRPHLEFGVEANGRYEKGPLTFQYDPDAQNGQPVWLSIRRNGSEFTGWISRDAVDWKQIGGALESPPMKEPRVGIFAHNGRTDAPAAEAVFDQLSYGANFHNQGQALPVSSPECYVPDLSAGTLLLRPQSDTACHSKLLNPVPEGDWDLSTKLDFSPEDGTLAGLNLSGSRSEARFIRWDINGPTITMEHLRRTQVSRPDFPGSPPVFLRLSARRGRVSASYSRDNAKYIPLPLQVSLAEIGDHPRVGIQAAQSSWTKRRSHPPDFQWLRFEVPELNSYR